MIRMPVPAPPDPMARTTDDAAGLDRQRERYEQLQQHNEHVGQQVIANRDAEALRQRERDEADALRAREMDVEERDARRICGEARTITNKAHVRSIAGSVVGVLAAGVGFVVAGLPGGVLALGAVTLGLLPRGRA